MHDGSLGETDTFESQKGKDTIFTNVCLHPYKPKSLSAAPRCDVFIFPFSS